MDWELGNQGKLGREGQERNLGSAVGRERAMGKGVQNQDSPRNRKLQVDENLEKDARASACSGLHAE
jgi:hypothetical protein